MQIKLTKSNTQFIKGIGIILIVFHNFFHHINPRIGENEYKFSFKIFKKFIHYLNIDSINFIQFISSYFGHYGVQLFIFCSGYGLTILYTHKKIDYKHFIIKRILKLYPAFTIAIILLLIYQYGIIGYPFSIRTVGSIIIRYTMISNFIPGKIFTLSGPYWFYSMIIQLYLIFPYLIKQNTKKLALIFTISYLIILTTNDFFSNLNFSLYYNFLGNLPVFILGILIAQNKFYEISLWKWIIALFIFALGQINVYIWCFSQILFIIISIPLLLKFNTILQNTKFNQFIVYTGKMSMYLFAIHGFLRKPWVRLSNESELDYLTYVYFVFFLISTYLMSTLLKKLEEILIQIIKAYYPIIKQYF